MLIKTKRFSLNALAFLLILLANYPCSAAPENPSAGVKGHLIKAVVVGIGGYADKDIKSFAGSANDAQRIAKLLSDTYGFQVKTLVNEKATKNEILSSIGQLSDSPQESSSLVIFLGNGDFDQLYDYTYWIPYDAKSGDVLSYISNSQISGLMKKIKSRHMLFLSGSSFPKNGVGKSVQSQDDLLKKFLGQSRYVGAFGMNSDLPDPSDSSQGMFGKAILSSFKKSSKPVLSANEFISGIQASLPAKYGTKAFFGVMDSGQNTGEFLFAKPDAQAALLSGGALSPDGSISVDASGKEAFMSVLSSVDDAEIYLNGIPWGKTPLKDKKVIGGTYALKISKAGYETAQSEITIQPGEKKDFSFDLVPLKSSEGTLILKVTPDNAKVNIIGSETKYSPGITLPPGKYQIEVSSFGFDSQKIELTLAPGSKTEKVIKLVEAANIANSLGMKFVKINPGTFTMGSPKQIENRGSDEVQHQVKITKTFYLQSSEVTVAQWSEFIKATSYKTDSEKSGNGPWIWIGHKWEQDPSFSWKNPAFKQEGEHPVVCVSWNDVNKFISWINSKGEGTYRLPTEAEWEYAARAGGTESFSSGACLRPDQANYDSTALWNGCPTGKPVKATVKAGSFSANAWGLYGMHGNVLEWCSDYYGEYIISGEAVDPKGVKTGTNRVARGGAWDSYIYQCRSAKRFNFLPEESYNNLGFRLVAE